jgi:hypothetical protein
MTQPSEKLHISESIADRIGPQNIAILKETLPAGIVISSEKDCAGGVHGQDSVTNNLFRAQGIPDAGDATAEVCAKAPSEGSYATARIYTPEGDVIRRTQSLGRTDTTHQDSIFINLSHDGDTTSSAFSHLSGIPEKFLQNLPTTPGSSADWTTFTAFHEAIHIHNDHNTTDSIDRKVQEFEADEGGRKLYAKALAQGSVTDASIPDKWTMARALKNMSEMELGPHSVAALMGSSAEGKINHQNMKSHIAEMTKTRHDVFMNVLDRMNPEEALLLKARAMESADILLPDKQKALTDQLKNLDADPNSPQRQEMLDKLSKTVGANEQTFEGRHKRILKDAYETKIDRAVVEHIRSEPEKYLPLATAAAEEKLKSGDLKDKPFGKAMLEQFDKAIHTYAPGLAPAAPSPAAMPQWFQSSKAPDSQPIKLASIESGSPLLVQGNGQLASRYIQDTGSPVDQVIKVDPVGGQVGPPMAVAALSNPEVSQPKIQPEIMKLNDPSLLNTKPSFTPMMG